MKIESLKSQHKDGNIWMFHRISTKHNTISDIYEQRGLLHTFDELICLMDEYLSKGYTFGSISEALKDNKIIHLTFDDGYKEHLYVAQVLKKRYNLHYDAITFAINIRNSFYDEKLSMDIVYHYIENNNLDRLCDILELKSKNIELSDIKTLIFSDNKYIKELNKNINMEEYYLNKEEVISLSKLFSIGSHCINHSFLTALNDKEMYNELNNSRTFLSSLLKKDIYSICYPDGKHSDYINEVAKKLGYTFGLSIHSNLKINEAFNLNRIIPRCK